VRAWVKDIKAPNNRGGSRGCSGSGGGGAGHGGSGGGSSKMLQAHAFSRVGN